MTTQFICDVCAYPSFAADHCDNPACLANPTLSEAHKTALRAADKKRQAEMREREERARMRRAGFVTTF